MKLPKWSIGLSKRNLIIGGLLTAFVFGLFSWATFTGRLTVFMAGESESAGSISGKVYLGSENWQQNDESQPTPVSGAVVKIIDKPINQGQDPKTYQPRWSKTATTNQQGSYSIGNIPTSQYGNEFFLLVSFNNQFRDEINYINFQHASDNELNDVDIYLNPGNGTVKTGILAGKVTEQGTNIPLANTRISVFASNTTYGGNSDTSGNYRISGIPIGPQTLNAFKSGYNSYIDSVNITYNQTTTKNIQLVKSSTQNPLTFTLQGKITNMGGQLLDATIGLKSSNPLDQVEKIFQAEKDYIGSSQSGINYQIPGLSRSYDWQVRVFKEGYQPLPVDIVRAAAVINVSVLTKNYQLLWQGTDFGKSRITGKVTLEGQTNHSGVTVGLTIQDINTQVVKQTLQTTTDQEGKFLFENVQPGSATVVASKQGYRSDSKNFALGANQEANVQLKLWPNPVASVTSVFGLVTDKNTGQPIQGAKVELLDSHGQELSQPKEATTDTQGKYELKDIAAGNYLIKASHPNYLAEEKSVSLRAGDTQQIDFQLMPQPKEQGSISGEIIFNDGSRDFSGVRIVLALAQIQTGNPQQFKFAQPDGNGHFIFRNLPLDRYRVTAMKLGYNDASVSVEINEDSLEKNITIELSKIAGYYKITTIQGKITSKADNHSLTDAIVYLVDFSGEMVASTSVSSEDGLYFIQYGGFCSSNYLVRAKSNGFWPLSKPILKCYDLNVIDFQLEPTDYTAGIFGKIYTTENNNKVYLNSALVEVYRLNPQSSIDPELIGSTSSENQGEFEMSLPDGVYDIRVALYIYEPKWINNVTVSGRPVNLGEIELVRHENIATSIDGQVYTINTGVPLSAIIIAVNTDSQKEYKVISGNDGKFTFANIEPGNYQIEARRGSNFGKANASVSEGQRTFIELLLCDARRFEFREIEGFPFYIQQTFIEEFNKELGFVESAMQKIKAYMAITRFNGGIEFWIGDLRSMFAKGLYNDKDSCSRPGINHVLVVDFPTILEKKESTFIHEFGHVFQAEKNLISDKNWLNTYEVYKSLKNCRGKLGDADWEYASEDSLEMFAVFFTAFYYYHGPLDEMITKMPEGECKNVLKFMWQFFAERVGKVNPDDAQKYPSIGSKVWTPDEIRAGAWMQRRSFVSRALSWVTAQAGAVAQTVVSAVRGNQGVIVGAISDSNQQVFKNATILISKPEFKKIQGKWVVVSKNYQVKTDQSGNFRLENVPAGFYFVTIITEDGNWLTPGHSFRTISVIGRGQTQEFNISLE